MDKNIFKTILIALLLTSFLPGFKCSKVEDHNIRTSGCIKGKLVAKGPCSQYVIQLLSGDTANADKAANWIDPVTNTNYTNVFTVKNYCYFADPNVGYEFYFYLVKELTPMQCNTCTATRATPSQSNEVQYTGGVCE